jgi:hypothetical protein
MRRLPEYTVADSTRADAEGVHLADYTREESSTTDGRLVSPDFD